MTDQVTREAQYGAVCTWGILQHAELERISALQKPVFIANGDSDWSLQQRDLVEDVLVNAL